MEKSKNNICVGRVWWNKRNNLKQKIKRNNREIFESDQLNGGQKILDLIDESEETEKFYDIMV